MDIILFGDIFDIVKKLLIPIDLYNLVCTCKYYAKNISKKDFKIQVINEINRRLGNILGENYAGFKKAMCESGAVIVGSFITQCILGEYWSDSDIDINVCTHKNVYDKNLFIFLTDKKYPYGFNSHEYEYINASVLIFNVDKFLIKLVHTKINNFNEYVVDSYKYDICKITYQYKDIISENDLQIHNFMNIANRCTNIRKRNDNSFLNHFKKYYNRRFKFYFTNDDKRTLFSIDDLQIILDKRIFISVRRITQDEIYLDDPTHSFIVDANKICSLDNDLPKTKGTKKVYQICTGSLPDNLRMTCCCRSRKNNCVTKLLFPNQKHLHSNIGIIILVEQ